MEPLPPPRVSQVATGQRTSIPLRSILNVEDGCDSADKCQPRTPPLERKAVLVSKPAVQRSQFLFINTHNSSRPNPRLRQDQKVINAHVQHTSHRKRRAAAIDRLRRTVGLCPQCASSLPREGTTALEGSSSPSSSASESSPARASTRDGPLRRRPHKASQSNDVCGRCGTSLQSTGGSPNGYEGRHKFMDVISSVTTALASSEQKFSPLTFFVDDQPTTFLDSGLLDPFATSSVSLNMEMNGVLLHFIQVIVGGMYPVRSQAAAQTEFSFQICLAEPSAMFAVLAISAADLQARIGRLPNGSIDTAPAEGALSYRKVPAFMDYKAKAIKAVNEKIASTAKSAEVTTLVVIMSILLLESITGDQNELSRHVTELKRLLTLRGGYHGLPTGVVSAAVPISYMSAIITGSFPISPPVTPLRAASPATYMRIMSNTDPQLKQICNSLLEPDIAKLFDESLVQVFHDTREIILYREFFHHQECVLPEIEVEYFSNKAYEIVHRTISIPFKFPRAVSPCQEPCRLALLVFWHANYAIHLPDSGIFRSLTTQIKSALEKSDPASLWDPHYRLFIWVMFLGAYISVGQREYSWFMTYLARAAQRQGLKTSKDLKAVLQNFFYIDRIYCKGLEIIWEEAGILMDAV